MIVSKSITDSRNGRFTLFGLLYFVQGAMLAYVLVFNNLYLRQFGATAGQLSLLNGLLVVPFILKIGIGLLSDKVRLTLPLLGSGNRVPYISTGLILIAVGGIGAAFIPPVAMYPLFVAVALFIAMGLALYDTVMDGLAIDVTPDSEQGQVQAVMVIGRALGLVMMSAIYGRVITAYGWQIIFWAVALFALTPLSLLWFVHEPAERAATQTFSWAALRGLWRVEIARFSLYAIVYSVAVYGANAIVALFANEKLGGTLVQVGDVAALGGVGMVLGGILGVVLTKRVSIWQQGIWTTGLVSLSLLSLAWVATLENIGTITLLWGVVLAAAELVFITLAMAKSDRRMGAGQFAIFMAISNVGTGMGQAATTGLIDTVDFHWIFVGLALINLLAIPLLLVMQANDSYVLPGLDVSSLPG
ncbi:MAG: MFS transporter [Ardenticatenaceae bacterium]|nr:MFS transporter [Ardenticatenaceae bacterium]